MYRRFLISFLILAIIAYSAIPQRNVNASPYINANWVRPNNNMSLWAKPGAPITLSYHAADTQGLWNRFDGVAAYLAADHSQTSATMTKVAYANPGRATTYDGSFTFNAPSASVDGTEWLVFLTALGTNQPYCSGNHSGSGYPNSWYYDYWGDRRDNTWGQQKDCGPYDVILLHLDNVNPTTPTVTCSPSGWTTGTVSITASGSTDEGSGFSHYAYNPASSRSTYGTLQARAVDKVGNTSLWATCTAKIDTTAPAAPTAAATESHGAQTTVLTWRTDPSFTWTAVTDNNPGSGLAGYDVYWGTSSTGTTPTTRVTAAAYTPTTLSTTITTPTNYYLRVRSVDNVGNASSWVTMFTYRYQYDNTPPAAPTTITESHNVPSDVEQSTVYAPTFTWTEGTDDLSGIQAYRVYWGTDPLATTPLTDTANRTYTPEALRDTATYYLRVVAFDRQGNQSSSSSPFIFRYKAPLVPKVIQLTPDSGSTNLDTQLPPGMTVRLIYGPNSTGAFTVTITTGETGPFPDPVTQVVFPNVFTPTDGATIPVANETAPNTYTHTYSLAPESTVSGYFDIRVVTASGAEAITTFRLVYDGTAPQLAAFNINTTSLTSSYLDGATLYYGPTSSGSLTASFQASDATGVREVGFPALFQSGAETVPGGEGSAAYAKTYAVAGAGDTTAGSFDFVVTDRVGNASQQTVTIVKDTTDPVVVLELPSVKTLEYTVQWTTQENESGVVSYIVEGRESLGGTWRSLTLAGDQTQLQLTGGVGGIDQVKVTAVDRVGNTYQAESGVITTWQPVTKSYTFGGQPVAVRRTAFSEAPAPPAAGEVSYLVTDHLNSTGFVLTLGGRVVAERRYLPFGEARWSSEELPTDRTYTGQRQEGDLGLIDCGARWYDPKLGRFIQPDPIVPSLGEGYNPNAIGYVGNLYYSPLTVDYHENQFLEQINKENALRLQDPFNELSPVPTSPLAFDRYAYGLNNPIRYNDPTGHFALALGLTFGVGFTISAPVIIIGAFAIVATALALHTFLPGREQRNAEIRNLASQAAAGIASLFANKKDVGFVDYLQKKYGISDPERRELHDELTRRGLSNAEWEAEFAEYARLKEQKVQEKLNESKQEPNGDNIEAQ